MTDAPPPPPLRSYGRVKSRTLKPRQAGLVDTLLPGLAIAPPQTGEIELPAGRRVILEIGFGGGEHLVGQARADPEALFLGAEPFLNGVASCLRHIEDSGAANVRLHHGDARDLIARLPAARLERVDILFPDPWPKTRHWKRRLIQPDLVAALARILRPGGELRFATDWKDYAAWTLERVCADPRFDWIAARAADWRAPWPGHIRTRYERKALGDTAPVFLRFRRTGG
jgi:tRNA (guanine-N7-)-methyltransferase